MAACKAAWMRGSEWPNRPAVYSPQKSTWRSSTSTRKHLATRHRRWKRRVEQHRSRVAAGQDGTGAPMDARAPDGRRQVSLASASASLRSLFRCRDKVIAALPLTVAVGTHRAPHCQDASSGAPGCWFRRTFGADCTMVGHDPVAIPRALPHDERPNPEERAPREPFARQTAPDAAPDADHPPLRGAGLGRLPRRQDLRRCALLHRRGGGCRGRLRGPRVGRSDHLDASRPRPLHCQGRRPRAHDGRALWATHGLLQGQRRLHAHRRFRHRHAGANGIVGGGISIVTGAALAAQMEGTAGWPSPSSATAPPMRGRFTNASTSPRAEAAGRVRVREQLYAAQTSAASTQGLEDVGRAKAGYGIHGTVVDGNDIFAVHQAAYARGVAKAKARRSSNARPIVGAPTPSARRSPIRATTEIEAWKSKTRSRA